MHCDPCPITHSLSSPLDGHLMTDQHAEMALGHRVITRPTQPFSSFRRSPLSSFADRAPWPPAPAAPLHSFSTPYSSVVPSTTIRSHLASTPRCTGLAKDATNVQPATGLPKHAIFRALVFRLR